MKKLSLFFAVMFALLSSALPAAAALGYADFSPNGWSVSGAHSAGSGGNAIINPITSDRQ